MLKIFPKPEFIKINEKNMSDFAKINLIAPPVSKNAVDLFQNAVAPFENSSAAEADITFISDPSLKSEAYRIESNSKSLKVFCFDESGAFYALQTIMQMIIQSGGKIPEANIFDSPKYPLRAFMLDCGRYFFSVNDVKTFLKRMALHKLNLFHFHITEDQGWRIEIKKYPLLTQIGSKRACTNFNNKPHGGYYTQKDIKEIVDYAHSLCIKVMPEFDIPGHTRAAIAAYSYLSCFNRELPVATHWGVKHDVMCPGKESTFDFVFGVIDELCELFPDGLIHIGGDEVYKHRWKLCPDCQKRIKDENLSNEDELQAYFMNRVADYIEKKGARSFMWNWDASQIPPNSKIGYTACENADASEREIIDTSTSAYYIDLPYSYISLHNCAAYVPAENAAGVEAALWCEYVPDMKKADIMTYPRLGAICEAAWNKSASEFENELSDYYHLLEHFGISYSKGARINPKGLRKLVQTILFERRQLAWEGVHNLIDDFKIEKKYKK